MIDLEGARFNHVNGHGLHIVNAVLDDSTHNGGDYSATRRSGGSVITGGSARHASFEDVNFASGTMEDVDAPGITLAGANFAEAMVWRMVMLGGNLKGARFPGGAHCCRNVVRNGFLSGMSIPRGCMADCDLTDVDASGLYAPGVDLSRLVAVRILLFGANLTGAQLIGAVMTNAGVDEHTILNRANVVGADLDGTLVYLASTDGLMLGRTRAKGLPPQRRSKRLGPEKWLELRSMVATPSGTAAGPALATESPAAPDIAGLPETAEPGTLRRVALTLPVESSHTTGEIVPTQGPGRGAGTRPAAGKASVPPREATEPATGQRGGKGDIGERDDHPNRELDRTL
jgi:uncharacterized protein YjbI with pentapeptide repeats